MRVTKIDPRLFDQTDNNAEQTLDDIYVGGYVPSSINKKLLNVYSKVKSEQDTDNDSR